MATAMRMQEPAFPSVRGMRHTMMTQLWSKYDIQDVKVGKCGPTTQRCYYDVVAAEEAKTDADITDCITYRMTKTLQQDDPPHYPITDKKLVKMLLQGLAATYPDMVLKWNESEAPVIHFVSKITPEIVTSTTNCIIEFTEQTEQIILWTRRTMKNKRLSTTIERRPKRPRDIHREDDRPP